MGREKAGKPRRRRGAASYTLRQLQPPGSLYEEWFRVGPEMTSETVSRDSRLSAGAVALAGRLQRLVPLYDGSSLPAAAASLDIAIDDGQLGMLVGDGEVVVCSLDELVEMLGIESSEVREELHRLHAAGLFLMESHHDRFFIRMVAKRPRQPGEEWVLEGELAARALPKVCVPNQAQEELDTEQFAALTYMRAKKARLEEPDPREYGRFKRVRGTRQARGLFEAVKASGWVDHRGCEACPAAHLCTGENAEAASSASA